MKEHSYFRHIKRIFIRCAALSCILTMCAFLLSGCLFGNRDNRPSIRIVTGDVSDQYDLAIADIRDVELIGTISCTYSQLREDKLNFELDGYRVRNVFVEEGQDVKEGDLIAELDVSAAEKEVFDMSAKIRECELSVRQTGEMIDFYDSRINSSAYSLAAKEEYILSKEKCEEDLIGYRNSMEYYQKQLAKDEDIIARSKLYSTMDGTVSSIRDNIMDWTSNKSSSVFTIIDTSVCAFQALDSKAVEYLKVGDRSEIVLGSGASYPATVYSVDKESFKIVFELDDPDFSIPVGTRGTVNQVLDRHEQVLAVPRMTVYNTDEYYYVFKLSDNGVRELQKIETGLIGTDYVEVLSGLDLHASVILR